MVTDEQVVNATLGMCQDPGCKYAHAVLKHGHWRFSDGTVSGPCWTRSVVDAYSIGILWNRRPAGLRTESIGEALAASAQDERLFSLPADEHHFMQVIREGSVTLDDLERLQITLVPKFATYIQKGDSVEFFRK